MNKSRKLVRRVVAGAVGAAVLGGVALPAQAAPVPTGTPRAVVKICQRSNDWWLLLRGPVGYVVWLGNRQCIMVRDFAGR
jgi:hypothetical protein